MSVDELGFPHTFLAFLSRPPGYKKLLQYSDIFRTGKNILEDDWNLCIILDACRADLLNSVIGSEWSPPNEWAWNSVISLDSHTIPWAKKTFITSVPENATPVTYVTATPQSVEINTSRYISHLDEIWRYGWDDTLGTVPPRVVTDRAIHHYRRGADRVMAHYLQPHVPLLTRRKGELQTLLESEDSGPIAGAVTPPSDTNTVNSISLFDILPGEWKTKEDEPEYLFDRLRNGDINRRAAWEGYRETLCIALAEVTTLLRSVDAEKVVITADHGNAFGEWGIYGHPHHMPLSVLREVPYVSTSATSELDYEPDEYQTESQTDREEQLKALGYR